MVTFNDKSFTIEVHTGICPIEDWLLLKEQLCTLIMNIDEANEIDSYAVLNLIRNLDVDYDSALKMFKVRDVTVKELNGMVKNEEAC